eukprot:14953141-Ditylum_brightwellii.AAC.1
MKKQKVSNVGKDCEESENDNRSGINGQCGEMENEDYDEWDCDSISNSRYSLKSPKGGLVSYHDLSNVNLSPVSEG